MPTLAEIKAVQVSTADAPGAGYPSVESLGRILALARASGVENPGKVEFFNWLPSFSLGIRVCGPERREGRTIRQDKVLVFPGDSWLAQADHAALLRLGDYVVDRRSKHTETFREYGEGKRRFRVQLIGEVAEDFADAVVSRFLLADYRIEDGARVLDMDRDDLRWPSQILRDENTGTYTMVGSEKSHLRYRFRVVGGEIVIIGVDLIHI